jgi:hypothetical protein
MAGVHNTVEGILTWSCLLLMQCNSDTIRSSIRQEVSPFLCEVSFRSLASHVGLELRLDHFVYRLNYVVVTDQVRALR